MSIVVFLNQKLSVAKMFNSDEDWHINMTVTDELKSLILSQRS